MTTDVKKIKTWLINKTQKKVTLGKKTNNGNLKLQLLAEVRTMMEIINFINLKFKEK